MTAVLVFFLGVIFALIQEWRVRQEQRRQLHGLMLAQYYELSSVIDALQVGDTPPVLNVLPKLRESYSLLFNDNQELCDLLESAAHKLARLGADTPDGKNRRVVGSSFETAKDALMDYLVKHKVLDNLIGER